MIELRKSIKVLVISNYRDNHAARPEAECFIGMAKLGFQVTVMTYVDALYAQKFKKVGIAVIDFQPEKKFDRTEINIIRQELIKGGYDILHLFNSKAIINGIRAAKNLPVKVVLYRGYAGNIHWYDPTAYFKFLHPRVDCITCNSKGVEESVRSQLLFRKKKAITIIKGHDLSWYQGYTALNLYDEFNIPKGAFICINVANNRPMKGIPFLLQAMRYIPKELNVYLILIGNGMDSPANLKEITQAPIKERIILAGFRSDVLNLVASSHLFVLSSIKGEGMNKAVIEAMAFGKPAIVTEIPGNTDLVAHEINGLIVPPHDAKALAGAIARLAENRDLCHDMGLKAIEHVETRLNLNDSILQTKALYEKLCFGNLI